MNKRITKSLTDKHCIRFATNHPDEDVYNGIVIHKTRSLVVICVISDFEVDGIIAFPRKRIEKVRDDDSEICENKIIRMNGEIRKIKKPKWLVKINTIGELIQYLCKKKIWPAVEIIHEDNEGALYIGPITEAGKNKFTIYCYDAAGDWEQEYTLNNSDIFKIEFNSKYTNHFNSYMKSI